MFPVVVVTLARAHGEDVCGVLLAHVAIKPANVVLLT